MIDVLEENPLQGTERLTGTATSVVLSAEAAQEIELARITNLIAAAITSVSWGSAMSTPMRRAYAEYCRRYDVDPVTEMDNLGGTPYINADWFKRKLGELRMAGIVKDVVLEHIHADPRLDALRKDEHAPEEIRAEANRRWYDALFKRVKHNAPEKAEAICVCTITLVNGGGADRRLQVGGEWHERSSAALRRTVGAEPDRGEQPGAVCRIPHRSDAQRCNCSRT